MGLTDALLRPSGGISRDSSAQYPIIWVEDAARMYSILVRKLLFPTPEDQTSPDIRGKVFHACSDPISDPLTWGHFLSGETQVGTAAAKRVKVSGTPLATAIKVAHINEWCGRRLSWTPFGKTTTYANVFFGSLNYPCESADAWRCRCLTHHAPFQHSNICCTPTAKLSFAQSRSECVHCMACTHTNPSLKL